MKLKYTTVIWPAHMQLECYWTRLRKIGIYIRNITMQRRKIAQPTYNISMQQRTISLKFLSKGMLLLSCRSITCSYLRFQQTRHTLTNLISWKKVLLSPAGWLVWACWSLLSYLRYMKRSGKLATICKPKKPSADLSRKEWANYDFSLYFMQL